MPHRATFQRLTARLAPGLLLLIAPLTMGLRGCDICEYNGLEYQRGDEFLAEDGVTTCVCDRRGRVLCSDATGCTSTDGGCEGEPTCQYGGTSYQPRDTFPADDGCNTCHCTEDGRVACTERACDDCAPGECAGPATCQLDGRQYKAGEVFPSNDGCNTCSCSDDGQVACTERACADFCGGIAGVSCPDGEFCDYPIDTMCGSGDQAGDCRVPPAICPTLSAPVCGCDGQTYGNACEAAAGEVSVVHDGACDGDGMGQTCGTRGAQPCAPEDFCNFPASANCGATDAPGVCEPRPDACVAIFAPVCGCDGKTHENACAANAAGVSVAADGECEDDGDGDSGDGDSGDGDGDSGDGDSGDGDGDGPIDSACGGLQGLSCASDEYCRYAPEDLCGAADALGRCEHKPDVCPAVADQVCGCDGKTYNNACSAATFGVSVASQGPCDGDGGDGDGDGDGDGGSNDSCEYNGDTYRSGESFPSSDGCNTCTCSRGGAVACTKRACVDFCGGIAGFGCPKDQFCNYPIETQCGSGDQAGDCQVPPQLCTTIYQPVCGCDGKTYPSACSAASAKVSVRSEGECP